MVDELVILLRWTSGMYKKLRCLRPSCFCDVRHTYGWTNTLTITLQNWQCSETIFNLWLHGIKSFSSAQSPPRSTHTNCHHWSGNKHRVEDNTTYCACWCSVKMWNGDMDGVSQARCTSCVLVYGHGMEKVLMCSFRKSDRNRGSTAESPFFWDWVC